MATVPLISFYSLRSPMFLLENRTILDYASVFLHGKNYNRLTLKSDNCAITRFLKNSTILKKNIKQEWIIPEENANNKSAEYVELYLTQNSSLVWNWESSSFHKFDNNSIKFSCSGSIRKHNIKGLVIFSFDKSIDKHEIVFNSENDDFYVFLLEDCENNIFPKQIFSMDIILYQFPYNSICKFNENNECVVMFNQHIGIKTLYNRKYCSYDVYDTYLSIPFSIFLSISTTLILLFFIFLLPCSLRVLSCGKLSFTCSDYFVCCRKNWRRAKQKPENLQFVSDESAFLSSSSSEDNSEVILNISNEILKPLPQQPLLPQSPQHQHEELQEQLPQN